MKNIHYLLISFFLIFGSCATTKDSYFLKANYNRMSLREAINMETKIGSRPIVLDFPVQLAESVYPNKNKYPLAQPKSFLRTEDQNFLNKVEYYYNPKDSSVKAVLYEWNYLIKKDSSKNHSHKAKINLFKTRFEQIEDNITTEIGSPSSYNLESKTLMTNFKDEIKWTDINGINIYLYMIGNEATGYAQINMIMYRE
jgi:hypothetical protein